jgi:hypothetical protein
MPGPPPKRTHDDLTDDETPAAKAAKHAHPEDGDVTEGDSLHALLDFTALTERAAIARRFARLAAALLHDYHLVVAVQSADGGAPTEHAFEILELECYLRADGAHEDPFAHASEEQAVSGRWYVLPSFYWRVGRD